jgi:hypothetical protein
MSYDFAEINGPQGRDNKAGLAVDILVADLANATTVAVPGTYTNPGDEVIITGDHVFSGTEGFVKIRFVPDSNGLTGSFPEGRDSSGYNAVMEGDIVAESEEEISEVLRNFQTTDIICLVKNAQGKYIQLGTEDFPAQLRPTEDTTGTSVEGQNKQRVQVIANQQKKYFYEGTITLKS